MVALLKKENKILNMNAMHQNTSLGHPSSNKAKDKGETLMSLQEAEFEKNKEYWLGRVNEYLEKLLKRANRETKLQRNMARHYFTRNLICKIRLKNMKKRLRKSLKKPKRRDSLDILDVASLIV